MTKIPKNLELKKCQNLSFLNMYNQEWVADFNRLFFFNIMGWINTTPLNHVANLGGWTGITSLGDSSELESIFGDLGTIFTDNLSKKQLENAINRSTYDGIMINNTSNFIADNTTPQSNYMNPRGIKK